MITGHQIKQQNLPLNSCTENLEFKVILRRIHSGIVFLSHDSDKTGITEE